MDSQTIIQDTVEYINAHLKEPLSLETLADRAGFSPYHFSRMFTLYMEMSIMEYVRRRRLACAADELCTGKRVLDVAMDYGFESHNGFAKAFRKIYGFSPNEYRSRVSPHRPIAPNPLVGSSAMAEAPNVRIEQRDGFYVAGYVVMTTPTVSSIAQQPALWNRMWLAEQDNKMYAMARPREHGEYYLSFPVGGDLYRLVTCVKIQDPETVDDGLYVDWVPPGLYGIFSTPPTADCFAEMIVDTWRYIFDVWLPESGYVPDPQGLYYEFYDERCHGAPYSMDICIPLKGEITCPN
jgi:AraC family transcriptional regulator